MFFYRFYVTALAQIAKRFYRAIWLSNQNAYAILFEPLTPALYALANKPFVGSNAVAICIIDSHSLYTSGAPGSGIQWVTVHGKAMHSHVPASL